MPKQKMKKAIKYVSIILGLAFVLGITTIFIFFMNFDLFGSPEKELVQSKCDEKNLRKAVVYKKGGNAVTNPSINVSISSNCNNKLDYQSEDLIFTADSPSLGGNEVEIEWISNNKLRISYDENLRIFTQQKFVNFDDSLLNLEIEYKGK